MATRTKEKAAARKANADKRPQAHARFVRISPRKVKIVIDLIRGKNVDEALAILQYTPKAASPIVMKVLNSAIANAVNNQELNRQNLYVAEVPRQRIPDAQAHQPHQRGAGPEVRRRRKRHGSESKSPWRAGWRDL